MSNTKNTGGAAFPSWDMTFDNKPGLFSAGTSEGMTLRDHFAGLAMAAHYTQAYNVGDFRETRDIECGQLTLQCIAEAAYKMADQMLKAREQ
jgi:hypothetical protein